MAEELFANSSHLVPERCQPPLDHRHQDRAFHGTAPFAWNVNSSGGNRITRQAVIQSEAPRRLYEKTGFSKCSMRNGPFSHFSFLYPITACAIARPQGHYAGDLLGRQLLLAQELALLMLCVEGLKLQQVVTSANEQPAAVLKHSVVEGEPVRP